MKSLNNIPDRKDEEPLNEKCAECGYPINYGEECAYCKEWRDGMSVLYDLQARFPDAIEYTLKTKSGQVCQLKNNTKTKV